MKLTLFLLSALIAPLSFAAEEEGTKIEISGNDQMQYDTKAFEVTEGETVTLVFTHSGQLPAVAMGHNVVILKTGTDLNDFAVKASQAKETDYVPADEDSKKLIIAHTKMVGGGESDTITFTAPAAGEYPFVCTFPGHLALMQGVMTVKAK